MSSAAVVPEDVLTASIRDIRQGDINFVFDSWGQAWVDYACATWKMQRDTFWRRHKIRFDALYARKALFKIACDPDNEDFILGWACAEPPTLHFVYVKRTFRLQGIATSLVAACGLGVYKVVPCSAWTPCAAEVAQKKTMYLNREIL